jgi:hypothetical protein
MAGMFWLVQIKRKSLRWQMILNLTNEQRNVFGCGDASERIKKITYKTTKIDKIVKMIWKK